MPGSGPFRALSMDLWFTTFYHTLADEEAWERARVRVLTEQLSTPDRPLGEEEVAAALREVLGQLRVQGHPGVTTPPEEVVRATADRLGVGSLALGWAGVRAYASAGLDARPPRANPEADRLLRHVRGAGIPTVLVTNSSRPASAWEEFLRRQGEPRFDRVVSSCDLGFCKPDPRLFREAARLVGVPSTEVLHVGDRWELDVVGARAAGLGAALYRGLWGRYPEGMYSALPPPPADTGDVRLVDRLETLAEPSLWRT